MKKNKTMTSSEATAVAEEMKVQEEGFTPAPCDWFDEEETDRSAEKEVANEQNEVPIVIPASKPCVVSEPPSPPPAPPPSPSLTPPRCSSKQRKCKRDRGSAQTRRRQQQHSVGAPLPSPSWNEMSSRVLPQAAQELLSNSASRVCYLSRRTYVSAKWYYAYSELGNTGGYFRPAEDESLVLPKFSSLPWVDRQMVQEWRTYAPHEKQATEFNKKEDDLDEDDEDNDDDDFIRARTLVPAPLQRPAWQHSETCHTCRVVFGPTRLRHHCRQCGYSFCQSHSSLSHPLPHLGYLPQLPERVCDACKRLLLTQNLAERVAWRQARCRDYLADNLTPYFETAVDTVEDALIRLTQAAVKMARSIPLGAQATVAVETVDVLRKHGLNGIYTIMLRQEFLAAADLLRKALGINRTAWPLSVHELSAAIFYALAQHRAFRGINPDREEWTHRIKPSPEIESENHQDDDVVSDHDDAPDIVEPVCDYVSDGMLSSLIFYAPIALNFIYATKEVDMQLLAAQQGWHLVYACLEQEVGPNKVCDRPASALFVHEAHKVACLAVRGTATIQDIVTDIRQIPVPFPPDDLDHQTNEQGWTTVSRGQGLAVCGMAGAAANLYREHADSLFAFAKQGYRIRLTGHSLGGGVAALLGVLLLRDLKSIVGEIEQPLRVYTYGTTACVDADLADFVEGLVVSVVHHDDVVPRMTPASCRDLLKHLLHIRETWVKEHLESDIMAVTERARTAWAPRWRTGFTLSKPSVAMKKYYLTPSSIKRYYHRKLQSGTRTLKELGVSFREVKSASKIETTNVENFTDVTIVADEIGGANIKETTDSSLGSVVDANVEKDTESSFNGDACEAWEEPKMLVDILGGIASKSQGLIIDGDEFFDTEDDLIDSEQESSFVSNMFDDAIDESIALEKSASPPEKSATKSERLVDDPLDLESVGSSSSSLDIPVRIEEYAGASSRDEDEAADEDEDPGGIGAVVLQDTPLPRMYVPGKIVHVYSHRGVYKASYVPKNFRDIRKISLAGNMLSDHKSETYYHGLLEVRSVRQAGESAPQWTAFDEDSTCSCCCSPFTWASTSDSEAQEARDKHNCRSCGTLVCEPCSTNRMPLSSIGLTVPSRVCDRCYNDIDGVATGPAVTSDSFLIDGENEIDTGLPPKDINDRPERRRARRSSVVDELVHRVKASPLKCS